MGYEGVELYDLFGRDPRRCGHCSTSSVSCVRSARRSLIENDLDELTVELRELGSDRLCSPGSPCPHRPARPSRSWRGSRSRRPSARPACGSASTTTTASSERSTTAAPFSTGCSSFRRSGCSWRSTSAGPGSPASTRWTSCARGAPRAARARQGPPRRLRAALRPCRRRRRRLRERPPRDPGLGVEWLLVEQDETDGSALDAVRRSYAAVAGSRREPGMRSAAQVGIVGCGVISRARPTRRPSTRSRSAPARTSRPRGARRSPPSSRSAGDGRGAASVGLDRRRPQPHPTGLARRSDTSRARGGQARVLREAAGNRRRGCRRAVRLAESNGCASDARPTSSSGARTRRPVSARRGRDRRAARHLGRDGRWPGGMASGPRHLLPRRGRPAARHGAVLRDGDRLAARSCAAGRGVRLDLRRGAHHQGRAATGERSRPRPRRTSRRSWSSRAP